MGVSGQHHAPVVLPAGKNRYPSYTYRGLDGPPGPVYTGAENLAPPAFDPRAVQPVASRSADCANPAHHSYCLRNNGNSEYYTQQ